MTPKVRRMVFAGIDIGAATAKVAILREHDGAREFYHAIVPTGGSVKQVAFEVAERALAAAAITFPDVDCWVATGYGRNAVPFANKASSEILCHGKGVRYLIPDAQVIIDIGGQDSKVIELDARGRVVDFVMNDKCAAGTGRFLEVIAGVLQIGLDELGPVSLSSTDPCQITSTCTVFAESEVVSLRAEGRSREDIVAGVHRAIAYRTQVMGRRIALRDKVVFTGGAAKNIGLKKTFENLLRVTIYTPEFPQLTGAIGAAIEARETWLSRDEAGA